MGTEREVVGRAQQGDERAYEALVIALHPRLFRLAHGVLRDPALAEEATQQAFLDLWRSLPRLRDPEALTASSYRSLLETVAEQAAEHPERLAPEPPAPEPSRAAVPARSSSGRPSRRNGGQRRRCRGYAPGHSAGA